MLTVFVSEEGVSVAVMALPSTVIPIVTGLLVLLTMATTSSPSVAAVKLPRAVVLIPVAVPRRAVDIPITRSPAYAASPAWRRQPVHLQVYLPVPLQVPTSLQPS